MADVPTSSVQSYVDPYGPALIGTFLASVYGITVLQTFLYYQRYSHDPFRWKILVAIVFVLDTVALGLFIKAMYYYLLESWGSPEMIAVDTILIPIIFAVLTFIVQCFYINTVRAFRAPVIVLLVLLALAVLALVISVFLPIYVLHLTVHLHVPLVPNIVASPLHHLAFNITRSAALAVDVGVVVTLCLQLRTRAARRAPGSRAIKVLATFALQRGILQTLVQAGELLVYAIRPEGAYFLPFHVILSRVYCTSLLFTLMTRDYALSQDERARAPGTFTSVLDPPQLSTVDWEQRAQQVTLTLPECGCDTGDSSVKYPPSTSSDAQTRSMVGSRLHSV